MFLLSRAIFHPTLNPSINVKILGLSIAQNGKSLCGTDVIVTAFAFTSIVIDAVPHGCSLMVVTRLGVHVVTS